MSNKKHASILSRLNLSFASKELELAYARDRLQRALPMIRGACSLAAILVVGFYSLDAAFVPEESLDKVQQIRFGLLIPLVVLVIAVVWLSGSRKLIEWTIAVAIILVGLGWAIMLYLAGPSSSSYFESAVIITMLFAFFLLGQPFYIAVTIAWLITLAHVATLHAITSDEATHSMAVSLSFSIVTVTSILTYAAYQVEVNSRKLYMQSIELRTEQLRRQEADNARLSWLENIARFLRHELRNTMIGISSSLDLLDRKGVTPGSEAYLKRARQSVAYMRKLLQDSAEATTLEISLRGDRPNPLNIAYWLREHVEIYKQNYPDITFQIDISSKALASITEERIAQLLDKLVSNAVEHCAPDSPVTIALHELQSELVLTVTNRGSRLPTDKNAMFALFNSSKSSGSHENIGLGLYVARTIAESHGGSIKAIDLHDPPGAAFEVRIPAGFFNFRNQSGQMR